MNDGNRLCKVILVKVQASDSFVMSSSRVLAMFYVKEHRLFYHNLFSFYITVRTLYCFLIGWG